MKAETQHQFGKGFNLLLFFFTIPLAVEMPILLFRHRTCSKILNLAGDSKDARLSQSPSLLVSGCGSSHRKYKKIPTSQSSRSRKILSSTCGHCLERRQFWAVCFTVIFGYFIFCLIVRKYVKLLENFHRNQWCIPGPGS